MKKSILILSAIAILFGCKKQKTAGEFSPTDTTGNTVVSGSVSKNVITPNGSGGWISSTQVPVAGVQVSVKINKNSLYPNSNATGADVYTATTDAAGRYSINVKTNASGTQGLITIAGFSSTLDTLINGVTKQGLYASYPGVTSSPILYMGSPYTFNHVFVASNVTSNPNNIVVGSAIVTGSVGVDLLSKITTTAGTSFGNTVVPVPAGTQIYLSFDKDPTLLTAKQYTTTTDAAGNYTFNLATVNAGTAGFNQNATIWIADRAATRDTVWTNNGQVSTITGRPGVFKASTNSSQTGIYNTQIRNAVHISYTNFIAD
jgi:hypothetical protein